MVETLTHILNIGQMIQQGHPFRLFFDGIYSYQIRAGQSSVNERKQFVNKRNKQFANKKELNV